MAIDFSTANMSDFTPMSGSSIAREQRAVERHAAWQETQAQKQQDREQKALDREQRLAEKRQTRAEKGATATADYDTFLFKSVDDFEKEQAQKAKDANEAEWDKKSRAHTEAGWQAAEEQKALGVLNRGNRGFNFVEIDDAKDYVDRGEDALVDLKAASRGDSEAIKKLANNTGITVVSSSELTPTHPAFLSRSGFGSGEDGNPVVTEKFLAIAADRNRDAKAVAKGIANTMEKARKDYLNSNLDVVSGKPTAQAIETAPIAYTAEEIESVINTIRREDIGNYRAAKSLYNKYRPASTEGIQKKTPSQTSVGELGVGEFSDSAPSFTGNVFAELANLSKSPSKMFQLVRDYGDYLSRNSGSYISGNRALTDISGMVEAGNLDLNQRPQVKNPDGSVSTVRSMSIGVDDKEYLIPTVSEDGRLLTEKEAIEQFQKTGKHLGVFDSPESATAYAKQLHTDQAKLISKKEKPVDDRIREQIETADKIVRRLEEDYTGLPYLELRDALLNPEAAASALLSLVPGADMDAIRARAKVIAEEVRRQKDRPLTVENPEQIGMSEAILEAVATRFPEVPKSVLRQAGVTKLIQDYTAKATPRGTLMDAVKGAMANYRSTAGQIADVLTFQPDNSVGKYADPMSLMEWRKGTRRGSWWYGMPGGPSFEVGPERLKEYMDQYHIESTRDALNSLSHAARMGDLGVGRGSLFAYNPHTKEVDTNATLELNPNALYNDKLMDQSIEALRASGADEGLINRTIEKFQNLRKKSAQELVKDNIALDEMLGTLRDTWLGSGMQFNPIWTETMKHLDKHLSFKNFYNEQKEAGKSDEDILSAWQEKGQAHINPILRGFQIGTHKAIDLGTGAAYGALLFAQNAVGSRAAMEHTRTLWDQLNKKQEAEAELVRGNILADYTAEIANLGYQMVATAGAGKVGGLAGRALTRTALSRFAKATANVVAKRAEALVPAARPGLAGRLSGTIQRNLDNLAALNLERAGAGAGVNLSIVSQVAPNAYSDIFYTIYDREMEGKEPTAENTNRAQSIANMRALFGAALVSTGSTLINNRAGMDSFMRKIVGAKNLRGQSPFQTLERKMAGWRSKPFKEMNTKEKTFAVASYLYSQSKAAVEGATEELADEFQEWAFTELVKNGEISESSIATTDQVISGAIKIAFLGGIGGYVGSHLAGEGNIRFQTEAAPTLDVKDATSMLPDITKDASNIIEETGKAITKNNVPESLVETGKKVIEIAGEKGDAAEVAREWVDKSIAHESLAVSDETRKAWVEGATRMGISNFTQFRNLVERASEIHTYEGSAAASSFMAEAINDLPNTMSFPNKENLDTMRTMLSEALDAMGDRVQVIEVDDDLSILTTGDEDLDAAINVINGLTEPTEPTEPTATTEPKESPVAIARKERDNAIAPITAMVETGVVTPSSVETVDNMDAAIASFDSNTGAWLSYGTPLERGAKLVSLNEMTGINAPMITSNTGETIVIAPHASMYNTGEGGTPSTKWGDKVSALNLPTDGTGANAYGILSDLQANASPAQAAAIDGVLRALHAAGLDVAIRATNAPANISSPASITYMNGTDGKLVGGVIDLYVDRDNAIESVTGTVLHEVIHLIDRHLRATNADYSQRMDKIRSAIAENYNNIVDSLSAMYDASVDINEMNAIAALASDLNYGLRGPDEFASVAFSNPVMNFMIAEASGDNITITDLARYAEAAGGRRPIHVRLIEWIKDLIRDVRQTADDMDGTTAAEHVAEWDSYVARIADMTPGKWFDMPRTPSWKVDDTDYTMGNGVDYFNPMAYETDMTRRLSFGLAAEIIGTNAGNWVTSIKNGWLGATKNWDKAGINVKSEEQKLVVLEQMANVNAAYERSIKRIDKIGDMLQRRADKLGWDAATRKKWSKSILDMSGNMDNDIDPETVARINAEAQAEVRQHEQTRDFRIALAKKTVTDAVNRHAEAVRLANSLALNSEGRLEINDMMRRIKDMSGKGYGAMLDKQVALPMLSQQIHKSLSDLGSRISATGNANLESTYFGLARDTQNYLTDMINEADSPFSMEELLDRWSNLRNDFLYAESTNHPVIAPMIQDIAKARAEAKQIIREANEDFHAATKRAGVTRAGVATPAGSVWLKRDNAILNARRQKQAEYMAKRDAAEQWLLSQGVVGQLVHNVIADSRKEIAATQISIAKLIGDSRMADNAAEMNYLHRTYMAVGRHAGDFTRTMKDIIANPNGELAQKYDGLTKLLQEAAISHAEAHQRELSENVSQVLDNMQALAALHDELKLPLVSAPTGASANYKLLFEGVAKNYRNREILDFIQNNFGAVQMLADLRDGHNISAIYNKAMSMIAQADYHTKSKMTETKETLDMNARDSFLADVFSSLPGKTIADKIGSLQSPASVASEVNKAIPTIPTSAIDQIWNTPNMNAAERLDKTLNLLRGQAGVLMRMNGMGNVISATDLKALQYPELSRLAVNDAMKAIDEVLSKKRTNEDALAQRKRLPEWQRKAMYELSDLTIGDAIGTLQNTLSMQSKIAVNQLLADEYASVLKAQGVVVPPNSTNRTSDMVEISLKNTKNALNGMYADKDVADAIYHIYRPSDDILNSRTDDYKKVRKYWQKSGKGQGLGGKLSGMANLSVLIASPNSTLRNLYGTVAQMTNAGALPFTGSKEIAKLIGDWSQMYKLRKLSRGKDLASQASADRLVAAEDRYNEKLRYWQEIGLLDAGQGEFLRNVWKSDEFSKMAGEFEEVNEDSFFKLAEALNEKQERTKGEVAKDAAKTAGKVVAWPVKAMSFAYGLPDAAAKIALFTNQRAIADTQLKVQLARAKGKANPNARDQILLDASQTDQSWDAYVDRYTAHMVKSLLPTGSRTPSWVKAMNVFVAPFFMFQYHTFQSVAYNLGHAIGEGVDGVWAINNGMKKEGAYLLGRAILRTAGSFVTISATSTFSSMLARGIIASIFEDDDDHIIIDDAEVMRKLADSGLIPDYDKFGDLIGIIDMKRHEFEYLNLEYMNPFKNINVLAKTLPSLFMDMDVDKWGTNKVAELKNLLENTVLEESLLLNTATELFNEEDFNYKHSLSGDESVNVLPAVGNAILLAAGLNPSFGSGHTWQVLERVATVANKKIPFYGWAVKSGKQASSDTPDMSAEAYWLQTLGTGLRRPKDLTEALAAGLKNANAAVTKSKRMSVLRPDFYKRMESGVDVESMEAVETADAVKNFTKLVNSVRFVTEITNMLDPALRKEVLASAIESSGMSAKTYGAAMKGIMPYIISPQAGREAIAKLNCELQKSNTTDEGKRLIEEQKKLIINLMRKGSIQIDGALSTEEIHNRMKQ
jgi:hypothetical protein